MMSEAGVLSDGRYELLDGEIVKIMPNEPHTFVNMRLIRALVGCFGWDYVRMPGSLSAGPNNEPEPDAAVTRQSAESYLRTGIPPGSEFRLVVEVSDSTLWRDKGQKARLYAGAGVPEYWVVNLTGRTVIVHRRPLGEDYQSIVTYNENESLSPEAAPDYAIALSEIFPPQSEGDAQALS